MMGGVGWGVIPEDGGGMEAHQEGGLGGVGEANRGA